MKKGKKSSRRGGWAGKILKIDLSSGEIVSEPLTDDLAFGFLGSRGFDAKFLWDMVKPGIDPLGPENVLSLGAGLLTGTVFPECGRLNVGCLSALTGIFGYGNAGGWWPSRLKAAGYDQVIVTGKAFKPVYISINDDNVEIKDAGDIWGKTTLETEKILRQKHGRDVRVCGIGQAGENLVRTASTMVDGSFSAHGGSGAVWGSKNLKAIATT
jgi:aldehyde:ferredoxin oxidoreductase